MSAVETVTIDNTEENPLPFAIAFLILFLILLVVTTWALDCWNKSQQCTTNPNIWCSDTWTCNNSDPSPNVNACFHDVGPTGLASCLFGPTAAGATACLFAPTGGTAGGGTGLSCECTAEMTGANNCFSGCAFDIGSVPTGTICCCQPGTPGCQYSQGNLPAECQGQT